MARSTVIATFERNTGERTSLWLGKQTTKASPVHHWACWIRWASLMRPYYHQEEFWPTVVREIWKQHVIADCGHGGFQCLKAGSGVNSLLLTFLAEHFQQ